MLLGCVLQLVLAGLLKVGADDAGENSIGAGMGMHGGKCTGMGAALGVSAGFAGMGAANGSVGGKTPSGRKPGARSMAYVGLCSA